MKFQVSRPSLNFVKHTGMLVVLVCFILFSGWLSIARALTVSPVRLELSGDAGSSVVSSMKAINSESVSKTYFTNVQTFEAIDETGNPTFRVVSSDLATWIHVTDAVTLGPHESQDIPFSINVPANAEPGGYFAAVFLTETPPNPGTNSQVNLNAQVGTLVLFRVNGYVKQGADILEFDTVSHHHWFTSLPIDFYFRFQNSGQSWVKPLGDMIAQNFWGRKTAVLPANPNGGNVLPQSIRRFYVTWGNSGESAPGGFFAKALYQWQNFALGPYTMHLNLAYGEKNNLQGATAVVTVWVFPWQLLLVLLIGGIIAFYLLRYLLRRYNRWVRSRPDPDARRKVRK